MKKFNIQFYKVPLPRLRCGPGEPLRLVMLSDLHGNSYGKGNCILLQKIIEQKPDLIMIAGDMITAASRPVPEDVLALFLKLASRYPVFYGNGNHELNMKVDQGAGQRAVYKRYRDTLSKAGVMFLENKSVSIRVKGNSLAIYGLETDVEYYKRFCYRKMGADEVQKYLGNPKTDAYRILLAHNPMDFPGYAGWGADLVLSGHLHGGFMRLPVLGGMISPQMHLFPKYDRGLFALGEARMIVGAGIGNHFPPPRVFNPPELVVADLI